MDNCKSLLKRLAVKAAKRQRLEKAGWTVGSANEFLELAPEEAAYIEMKLELSEFVRKKRINRKLSQVELAELIESSQSRVAKMEAGDPSVSIDLLVKSLLVVGASRTEVAHSIAAAM
jgi:predicted XRE-type DNA-binding protein